ncbi:MAG: cytidylate kinase family protein [Clostridiales bacterium]|nr:cytidylate kinase family protein [Clostridiales bacterium]
MRNYENVVSIFIYALAEYRVQRVMKVYGDNFEEAKKNIRRSDAARASYYKKELSHL